ncbi:MAG: SDR family NAD(P)-dependent oxidoreductase [Candidatus Dormibacter sp.]|uniref:SDR family NAD(P)-dependent oxidoreductase n=1 Tax=Candidatus Dormibacter sp. TaxID=2973982 RepID=UPI000DB20ECC|nr:MAG: short-chain dehydrogenase [Candidatus Dormibacteraeota bacterium]
MTAGRLDRQVAVVTGGAQGIGRAIVEKLAAEGARVAAWDLCPVSPEDYDAPTDSVECLRCDVSSEADVAAASNATTERLGRVSVLVNNAGLNAYFDAVQMTETDWDAFMGVDLKGSWLCCKHLLPGMQGGGGVIVNIASIHAYMTTPGMFPYAAAKSGLLGLTRSLALDYGLAGVRAVAVCPGWIHTHLVDEWLERQENPEAALAAVVARHPRGRIGAPADVANLVAFLASDEASFITGTAHLVDGGLSAQFSN